MVGLQLQPPSSSRIRVRPPPSAASSSVDSASPPQHSPTATVTMIHQKLPECHWNQSSFATTMTRAVRNLVHLPIVTKAMVILIKIAMERAPMSKCAFVFAQCYQLIIKTMPWTMGIAILQHLPSQIATEVVLQHQARVAVDSHVKQHPAINM